MAVLVAAVVSTAAAVASMVASAVEVSVARRSADVAATPGLTDRTAEVMVTVRVADTAMEPVTDIALVTDTARAMAMVQATAMARDTAIALTTTIARTTAIQRPTILVPTPRRLPAVIMDRPMATATAHHIAHTVTGSPTRAATVVATDSLATSGYTTSAAGFCPARFFVWRALDCAPPCALAQPGRYHVGPHQYGHSAGRAVAWGTPYLIRKMVSILSSESTLIRAVVRSSI